MKLLTKIFSPVACYFLSNTPRYISLCTVFSYLKLSDQVPHPYKTAGNITLCTFKFLDIKLEALWTARQQALSSLILLINFFMRVILICWCLSETFELCYILRGCVTYLLCSVVLMRRMCMYVRM